MVTYMFIFALLFSSIYSTIDLNIHQLQFVADHLQYDECKKLSAALHETSFALKHPVDGNNEPNRTCIYLLLKWERTEGSGKTFNNLALRLKQIDRQDLADELSKFVYKENVDEIDRKFLNDPFKKEISKDNFLLGDTVQQPKNVENIQDVGLSGLEIAAIVLGALTLFCIVCIVVFKLFGNLIRSMFKRYAPEFLVAWVDLVATECNWCCRYLSKSYKTRVVGSKAVEDYDEQMVVKLNKNLNNYLNGNNRDAWFYFDKYMSDSDVYSDSSYSS